MNWRNVFILLLSLSFVPSLHAQYNPRHSPWAYAGFGFVTAEQIQKAIDEVDGNRKSHSRRVVVIDNTGTTKEGLPVFRTMGFTEKQVLDLVGDEKGATCSTKHLQGDMANRWCHASVVKVIDRSLRAQGISPVLAAIAGAAFFVPKEFLIDKNPSASDLVTADLEAYQNKNTKVEVSVFGDGAIFITLAKRF